MLAMTNLRALKKHFERKEYGELTIYTYPFASQCFF